MSINVEKMQQQYLDETCPKKRAGIQRVLEHNRAFFKFERVKRIYLVEQEEYHRHFASSLSFVGSNYPYLGHKKRYATFTFDQEKEFEEALDKIKQECLEKDNGLVPVVWIENFQTNIPFYE